jgi:hypothetical protein
MPYYGPSYTQYALDPLDPLDPLSPVSRDAADYVRFDISLGVENGIITLQYGQVGKPGQPYIAIEEDCVVEITLHGDQLFFSKELDGITTKEELSSFYGALEYDGYDKARNRYRIVRFLARYNRGGKAGTNHGFNVNIDFLHQPSDTASQWTGLTIDPDIKNPPPMPN